MARLSFAALTIAATGSSVGSGSAWIAGGLAVCAVAVAMLQFSSAIPDEDIAPLFESLRLSRKSGAAAVRAVVTPQVIFVAKSAVIPSAHFGYMLLFRDELDVKIWRELSTLLRHQPHDPQELAPVDRRHAFRFGKSTDL